MRARLWLLGGSAAASAFFALGFALLRVQAGSVLALAQGADSLLDVSTALLLGLAVWIGRRPPDAGHPVGHQAAEPVAAMGVAVLAGVLVVEVLRGTFTAWRAAAVTPLPLTLAWLLLAKAGIKGGLFVFLRWRRPASSALRALAVDAGNDTLLSLLSLGAFVPGQWAGARADVWLSLPVALWIGYAGVQLARETVQRLMGAAGSGAQHAALRQAVLATPGVRSVPRLDAYHHGNQLAVRVQVALDAALPVAEACRIVDAVRAMLAALPEVAQVSVECAVFRET